MSAARLLAAATAFWAAGAAAHAELVGSSPRDGAKLARAPSSIELRFNEPVAPLSLRLFGSSGTPIVLRAPPAADQVVRAELPPDLADGHYALSFSVTSLDSHPIGGSIAFTVGEAVAASPPAMERDALLGWRIAIRALRDLALLIATGGALFLLVVAGFPGERALLTASAAIAAVTSLLGIGLQGAAMLGFDAVPWQVDAWRTGLRSSFGTSACIAAAGALLIAAGAVVRGPVRRGLLALGALAAVVSFALTGHAAGARSGVFGPFALAAHVLAAAFWVGSLCALLGNLSVAALRRFSRLGIVAVAILVSGGVVFAVLQLPSLADLTGSEYGRLIVGKATLLLGLLALASLNRYRFLPMLERGDGSAAARLRASIAGEIALMACVVALTALLVQTAPPRAAGFAQTLQALGRVAELSVSPGRPGHNTVNVRFRDAAGHPFDPEEVMVQVSNPRAGVEPVARPMKREAPGAYSRDGAEILFAGTWTVEVQARIGDFDRAIFRSEVPIP